MKVYLVWKEKSDPFSEDGDLLQGVFSTLEKAMELVDRPNFDIYIVETELDNQDADGKIVFGS